MLRFSRDMNNIILLCPGRAREETCRHVTDLFAAFGQTCKKAHKRPHPGCEEKQKHSHYKRNPIFHGPDGILKEFLKQPFLNCPHNCKSLCFFTQRANCFTRTYIFCLTFNAVYGLRLRCFPSLNHSVILLQSLENLARKTCARFCMLRTSKYKVVSNFTDTLYLLPHKYENLPFSV